MNTTNKILTGLLTLQVLILLGMGFGGGRSRLALSETIDLLPGVEVAKISTLEILGPSKNVAVQDKVKLERKADGWVVADSDDFPAKKTEIEELLKTLVGLKSRNKVLSGRTYHEKLEVSDEAYRRKVILTVGSETKTLYIGSSPSFKNIHVRVDGDDAAYQVTGLAESDAGARAWNWVERKYHTVPKEEVWSVTLKNQHGQIQADRDPASDTWAVLGLDKPTDKTKVDSLVSDAREIGLESPVGKSIKPEYKFDEGATLTLVTGTATVAGSPPPSTTSIMVQIGSQVGDKNRHYVKASSSPYVIEAANWEVSKLLELKQADLLAPEPEKEEENSDK